MTNHSSIVNAAPETPIKHSLAVVRTVHVISYQISLGELFPSNLEHNPARLDQLSVISALRSYTRTTPRDRSVHATSEWCLYNKTGAQKVRRIACNFSIGSTNSEAIKITVHIL